MTLALTSPSTLVAVSLYVVVLPGFTLNELESETEPMPGDIVTLTALSRTSLTVHVNVTYSPSIRGFSIQVGMMGDLASENGGKRYNST